MNEFILNLFHTVVSINRCKINGKVFTWTVVSRRSIYRAGPRLFMRGIDEQVFQMLYFMKKQLKSINCMRFCRVMLPIMWKRSRQWNMTEPGRRLCKREARSRYSGLNFPTLSTSRGRVCIPKRTTWPLAKCISTNRLACTADKC